MKNALILHGTGGNPSGNWLPWLKKELEKLGYKVWVPALPQADKPNLQRYNDFILSHKDFTFNQDTIIVGHSSGALAILGLLQALPENTKVGVVFLVGTFNNDLGITNLSDIFLQPFDFELIKKKAEKFIFIHSDNDPYGPLEHARYQAEQTGGELIIIPGEKHFSISNGGEKYKEFPQLLEKIKEVTS